MVTSIAVELSSFPTVVLLLLVSSAVVRPGSVSVVVSLNWESVVVSKIVVLASIGVVRVMFSFDSVVVVGKVASAEGSVVEGKAVEGSVVVSIIVVSASIGVVGMSFSFDSVETLVEKSSVVVETVDSAVGFVGS